MATRAVKRQRRRQARTAPHTSGLAPVAEIIDRTAPPQNTRPLYSRRSVDRTVPDYAYWDRLRRGKLRGYKLSGLFAQRIERILAAWVFGEGVNVTLRKSDTLTAYNADRVDYTNGQLRGLMDTLLDAGQSRADDDPDLETSSGTLLPDLFRNAVGLGDQYAIVNGDGTISVPSPETVEIKRDKLDYRRWLAVKIVTRLDEATITDEYRAAGRTVTYEYLEEGRPVKVVEEYANLIGRIPVVHIAHGRSGNETNGHSIHEPLLTLYDQYDDVMEKMLDGVKLLGNPFLAFTGLESLAEVVDLNAPAELETYMDAQGNEVTRPAMNIDRNSVFAIGKGGDAKFVAPPVGFTEDAKSALNVLFWLLFEHVGVPESVWGGELSSARATASTQLVQFVKELRGWQMEQGGWIAKLCHIWLEYAALTDAQLIVEPLSVEWPDAIEEDKELLLKFLEFASNNGLITGEKLLELTALVEDASDEYPKAQAEAQTRADAAMEKAQAMAAAQPPPVAPVAQMHGDASVRAALREIAGEMIGAD